MFAKHKGAGGLVGKLLVQQEEADGSIVKIFVQDKEDDGLVGKIFLKEAISGKSEADLRVETCINEDIEEEEILFFGGSIGNTQENLLSNYKDKNTSLKYKDPVPGSYNLNTTKVLDVLIDETKTFFVFIQV